MKDKSTHATMEINVCCPRCGHKARPVMLREIGTLVVTRTCRGCDSRWLLMISPVKTTKGSIPRLEWLRIEAI